MSFIAKNPLTIPKVSKAPSAPIQGARGLFAKEDGWYDIDDSGNERKIISEDDLSAEIPEVIDNLTSTYTDKALSANQGKVLNDGKADKQTENGGFEGGDTASSFGSGAAIGFAATESGGGAALGEYSTENAGGGAVGSSATVTDGGGAVGCNAATSSGFAGGKDAKTQKSPIENIDAIQLGTGTNSTPKSLQVYNYQLMGADGNIPLERLNNAPKTEVVDSLESEDTTKALSAAQGKLLNDKKADREEMFDKLCLTGSAESLTSSLTLADGCGGTNVRNYVIHGAEGGVGDLNSDTGKYEIPVTVRGKNLMSIKRDVRHEYASGVIVEKGADYVIAQMSASASNTKPGSTSNSSGWIGIKVLKATAEAFNKCFFKDIKPSTTYTLSYDLEYFYLPDGLTSVKHTGQFIINGKPEYINTYVTEAGKKYHYKLTFTTPETISSMELFFTLNSCKVKFSNIMLEEGGSKTDYERYAEPQTAVIELSAPLGKNDHVVNASGTTYKNSALSKASTAEIPLVASGTNIIEVGTATAPGKIEVEYYKDINKIVNNLTNAILAQGGNV